MPSTNVGSNSSAQVTLKPIGLLPGQTFNFHNALNVEITITTQGKDVQIKQADGGAG